MSTLCSQIVTQNPKKLTDIDKEALDKVVELSKQAAKRIRLSDLKRENEFEGNFEENEDMS